ncbi:MAG: acyl-CoA dehydrogenase [Desulfomonilia bacterium]|mgnify:CR=1 FL=1|nr:acyl-CoA dehydrogenase [Desulfomonilia bacterium]
MSKRVVGIEDTRFVLFDQLDVEALLGFERFGAHSRETFEMILDAAGKLAENEFAPTNKLGDKSGCVWDDGVVRVPECFHRPFAKYIEGGWLALPESAEVGGQDAPYVLHFACCEFFYAANMALQIYLGNTHSAGRVIKAYGTAEQKERYSVPLYACRYAGTMTLTESQAGSDLGNIRTKATPRGYGNTYLISGQKIFITAGEHDLADNIVHILLGRVEGDPAGTKGLSCFIVPNVKVLEDGSLGGRNDVVCTGIEHKMGLKASSTCSLTFGENGQCEGELLGPRGMGISVMFHMLNEQRILVGLQGLAQASRAYLDALEYAKERRQGRKFGSRSFEQVSIVEHPDIKRHLLWMKACTEGMRSLILYTMQCMDLEMVCDDVQEKQKWQDMVDILTPICKAYSTDRSYEICSRAMQILGGYGYCEDYEVEQYARDTKITSIYEGTNGIQALDLFGRKLRMRDGGVYRTFLDQVKGTVLKASKVEGLSWYADEVSKAVSALEEVTAFLLEKNATEDAYLATSWATPYLEIFGDVVLGWQHLWRAMAAVGKMESATAAEKVFYESRLMTARYYIGSVLPGIYGKIEAININDRALLEVQTDHLI